MYLLKESRENGEQDLKNGQEPKGLGSQNLSQGHACITMALVFLPQLLWNILFYEPQKIMFV